VHIFVFGDGVRHGCFVFREEIPFEALERRGHTVEGGLNIQYSGGTVAETDLFVFPRLAGMDYPLVVDEIQRNGKPLVYEMDDAADLFERFHPSYFQVRNLLPSYYFLIRQADLVTTTTPHLAEHLKSLGAKRVEVLPNCPDQTLWSEPRSIDPAQTHFRIGYVGWTAHLLEAAYWFEIMAALRQLRADFTPVLYGIASRGDTGSRWLTQCHAAIEENPLPNAEFSTALGIFESSYRKVKPHLDWVPMTGIEEYASTLGSLRLDIGCAVLLDSPFNRCKSCVKFYDYAGAGVVTVASEVLPYTTEPMITVPNTLDAWVRVLNLLLSSALHRRTRLLEQRAWITEWRDADRWALKREQVYQSLLTPTPVWTA
jgi:O-antigen biosynthesis protein